MPYSIRTQDGIQINNIPDDIPRDSDILKQRVADARAQRGDIDTSLRQRVDDTQAEQPAAAPEAAQAESDTLFKESPGLAAARDVAGSLLSGEPLIDVRTLAEPVAAIGSGIASTVAGGVGGGIRSLFSGDEGVGADVVEAVQEAGTFQPRTEEGKRGLERVGDLTQMGLDVANLPFAGLAGLSDLITLQGPEKAAETVRSIQESGLSKAIGEKTLDITGSPLAATVAETLPTAADMLLGSRLPAAQSAKGVITRQSKTKREIARILQEGKRPAETVGFELVPMADDALHGQLVDKGLLPPKPPKSQFAEKLEGSLVASEPRVRAVPSEAAAVEIGFGPAEVKMISGMDDATRGKVSGMMDILERVRAKPELAVRVRPSDVLGDSVMERVKAAFTLKDDANKQLSATLGDIGNNRLNFDDATVGFIDDLRDNGVAIVRGEKGGHKLDFTNSSLMRSDKAPLNEAFSQFKRLGLNRVGGAGRRIQDAHDLKQILRRDVSFTGRAVPMSDKAQSILKDYAASLNKTIGENSTQYAVANKKFGDAVETLGEIDKSMGAAADIKGASTKALEDIAKLEQLEGAIGTKLRTTLSNAGGRSGMIKALNTLDNTLTRYNLNKFDDDIAQQIIAVDEIERVFGGGKTSLQGVVQKAGADPLVDAKTAIDAAQTGGTSLIMEGGRRLFGKKKVDRFAEQKMIDAMRKLLEETKSQTKVAAPAATPTQ